MAVSSEGKGVVVVVVVVVRSSSRRHRSVDGAPSGDAATTPRQPTHTCPGHSSIHIAQINQHLHLTISKLNWFLFNCKFKSKILLSLAYKLSLSITYEKWFLVEIVVALPLGQSILHNGRRHRPDFTRQMQLHCSC